MTSTATPEADVPETTLTPPVETDQPKPANDQPEPSSRRTTWRARMWARLQKFLPSKRGTDHYTFEYKLLHIDKNKRQIWHEAAIPVYGVATARHYYRRFISSIHQKKDASNS